MRPAARIQAAIELLTEIETATAEAGLPADRLAAAYFRARRYIGSKDRRAVSDFVYGVLRARGSLVWRLESAGTETSARMLVASFVATFPALATKGGAKSDSSGLAAEWGTGEQYEPEALSEDERAGLARAVGLSDGEMPAWARANLPEWLYSTLEQRFGKGLSATLTGFEGRAPTDLRVNTLKSDVEEVSGQLDGTKPCKYSPFGLRVDTRLNLSAIPAYRDGAFEIQDESSQLAAALCGAVAGEQVIDFCAGSGGKSLALAAMMENHGQIYAHDTDMRRLGRLPARAQKAGARNIQIIKRLSDLPKTANAVLLDVPCSASGTWRRNPDLRWRMTPERLEALCKNQQEILEAGAGLVRPGGRLIYAACSILAEESEEQIDWFMAGRSDFILRSYRAKWPFSGLEVPDTASPNLERLLLLPHLHETDGFFIAVMERGE